MTRHLETMSYGPQVAFEEVSRMLADFLFLIRQLPQNAPYPGSLLEVAGAKGCYQRRSGHRVLEHVQLTELKEGCHLHSHNQPSSQISHFRSLPRARPIAIRSPPPVPLEAAPRVRSNTIRPRCR